MLLDALLTSVNKNFQGKFKIVPNIGSSSFWEVRQIILDWVTTQHNILILILHYNWKMCISIAFYKNTVQLKWSKLMYDESIPYDEPIQYVLSH